MSGTVLLTGASGFIAKHVAVGLLDAGYDVRGTVRRADRGVEVLAAVGPAVADADGLDRRLTFAVADLERDDGWDDAVAGVDAVLHTASPFPIAQPKDEDEVIRPAVDGTLRVLRAAAAAGVERVVMTSSVAAIAHTTLPAGRTVFDEGDWTDPDHPGVIAYERSKLLSERAAWAFVADEAPALALTAVNPGLVLGPPLDDSPASSVAFVRRLLSGRDPMLPRYGLPIVDVRDVAEMHVRVLQRPATAGRRYAAVAGSMWLTEMGAALRAAHPGRRIATRTAPDVLMRLLGLVDREVRAIVGQLGECAQVANARAVSELDMDFIAPEEALLAMAASLVERELV